MCIQKLLKFTIMQKPDASCKGVGEHSKGEQLEAQVFLIIVQKTSLHAKYPSCVLAQECRLRQCDRLGTFLVPAPFHNVLVGQDMDLARGSRFAPLADPDDPKYF